MSHDLIIASGPTIIDTSAGLITPLGGSAILPVEASQLRNGNAPYHDELQYLALLQELVDKSDAAPRADRTGTGTFSVFGRQMRFDLTKSFPLLTTKNVWWKGVVAELLWMLSGSVNAHLLKEQGVRIWDEWADENGDLGPVYGRQWRSWPTTEERGWSDGIDQIGQLIQNLRDKPNDRGHVVSAWNAADLPHMALRPCHCLFQFYVDDGKLSCQLYQRSADIFLGVPFNIASYALLTGLIAQEVGLQAGEFIHTFGDLHLYANHVEQAKEQLTRMPRPFPQAGRLNHGKTIFELTPEDIILTDYNPHPTIKAEVSI